MYATARRAGDIEDLARAGAHTLALDVTDEASMAAAVEHIESKTGAVGVLVNNAGYSQSGAVESVTMDQVRRQFIAAILIEPGLIRSGFAHAAANSVTAPTGPAGPYTAFNAAAVETTTSAYETGPLARFGGTPDSVAKVVERAISAKKPQARYTVTPSASILIGTRRVLSDAAWDAFVAAQYPRPH